MLDNLVAKGIDTKHSGTYVMSEGEILFYSGGESGYKYYKYFDDSVLYVYEEEGTNSISFDRDGYAIVQNGINLLIYDELLDEIVGKIAFDADNGYDLIRWK